MNTFPSDVISAAELRSQLGCARLLVLDASTASVGKAVPRDLRAEHEAAHIPGAIFFDMAAASAPHAALPNTLPSAEHFAACASTLGIARHDDLVVYDSSGLGSAPRLWWMLRRFGHARVAVLDGGLPQWRREGGAVEAGVNTREPASYGIAEPRAGLVDFDAVVAARAGGTPIVDARPRGRFEGSAPEPRAGLPSGHIAGSRSLPHTELVNADGVLLPDDALRARFEQADVDPDAPAIVTCGSGVTACVLALALHRLGNRDVAVYDGSWSEWATRAPNAIVTTATPAATTDTPKATP